MFVWINIMFPIFKHDYGILVLKYLDMWEGLKRFDGKTMPPYSSVTLMQRIFYHIPLWIFFFATGGAPTFQTTICV